MKLVAGWVCSSVVECLPMEGLRFHILLEFKKNSILMVVIIPHRVVVRPK